MSKLKTEITDSQQNLSSNNSENNYRRKALKSFVVGGGVFALPNKWKKPIIQSVLLPAHAQASLCESATLSFEYTASPDVISDDTTTVEHEFVVTNNGPGLITSFTIQESRPSTGDMFELLSGGPLESGESVVLDSMRTYSFDEGETIGLEAVLNAEDDCGDQLSDTQVLSINTEICAPSTLSFEYTASHDLISDDTTTVEHEFIVTNNGPGLITSFTIQESRPSTGDMFELLSGGPLESGESVVLTSMRPYSYDEGETIGLEAVLNAEDDCGEQLSDTQVLSINTEICEPSTLSFLYFGSPNTISTHLTPVTHQFLVTNDGPGRITSFTIQETRTSSGEMFPLLTGGPIEPGDTVLIEADPRTYTYLPGQVVLLEATLTAIDDCGNQLSDTQALTINTVGENMAIYANQSSVQPGDEITIKMVTRLYTTDVEDAQLLDMKYRCNLLSDQWRLGGPEDKYWADPSNDFVNTRQGAMKVALDLGEGKDHGNQPDWIHEFTYKVPDDLSNDLTITAEDSGSVRVFREGQWSSVSPLDNGYDEIVLPLVISEKSH